MATDSCGSRNRVCGQDRTNRSAVGDKSAMRPFAKLLLTLVVHVMDLLRTCCGFLHLIAEKR